MGALSGLRVIDFSRHAPGPFCTMLLADFGADVIMVEQPPGQGRQLEDELGVGRRERIFNPVRRNKRSIALDLKDPEQRADCLALLRDADIVVEGFRPGVAARLGIDYPTLRELNPRLIYCSITGYGQTGPYRDLVGHDLNYIAIGGLLGLVGQRGGPPAIPANVVGDYAGGGLFAAFAILAAVTARAATGAGQYIDMAMSDGVLALLGQAASEYLTSGTAPRPGEYFLNGALPCYSVYQTADGGWLSIACIEPWFWERLCRRLGCEQLIAGQFDAARFPEMFTALRAAFRTKSRDAWFAELRKDDICVAPVLGLDEALRDPQNLARGMLVELPAPALGPVQQVGIAPKLSATPGSIRTLPPEPGEHTGQVLQELRQSRLEHQS
ncbi:MAG: CoA transferase [Gammaproteobacteria bacterium]|nr:CoA transferase [Gammaproteobacteria bacterium]